MLEYLRLDNVGPAPSMEMALAPRLNLLTGDNGLGKSFLLDVAWWALTRRWPQELNGELTSSYMALPRDVTKPAKIGFRLQSKTRPVEYTSTYSPRDQGWIGKPGRPANPGLVIYAHADGGFSVWDPARNYWKKRGGVDVQDTLPAYVFSAREIWNGRTLSFDGKETKICRGLIEDWAIWIREGGGPAKVMAKVLNDLAPPGESIEVGPLLRLSVNDVRDIPSIKTPYADAVRIVHASAGMRRIAGLAYIEPATGAPSVDHVVPRASTWQLVYEWSNYRLAAARINSKKRDRDCSGSTTSSAAGNAASTSRAMKPARSCSRTSSAARRSSRRSFDGRVDCGGATADGSWPRGFVGLCSAADVDG